MAIIFFEGLPGAGKSYEAMVTQIIPALQKGREVVAYIEGLNFERIAQAAGLELDAVKRLLFPVTREDMKPAEARVKGKLVAVDGKWLAMVRDNALHVFDEAQNWWGLRVKPTDQLTEFISEHRHRGMDIVLMGQSLKDVGPLWRRRVDQKLGFLKLTALGSAKRYRVSVHKGQGDDRFVKVSTKVSKYDEKYFGTYASHTSDEINTETYTDKRVQLFGSWGFRVGIPLVLAGAAWGGWTLWKYFHPAPPPPKPVAAASGKAQAGPPAGVQTVAKVEAAPPAPKSAAERYVAALDEKGRIRLVGMVRTGDRVNGLVEWVSGTNVLERVSLDQLRDFGVSVMVIRDAVRLEVGSWQVIATAWPMDPVGTVSDEQQRRIAGTPPGHVGATSPGVVVIDGAKGHSAPSRAPAADLKEQPSSGRVQPGTKWSFSTAAG